MIGQVLSHYKVIEEISRGGMGIVYRAVDLKLDRDVAIKVLPPELVSDEDRKRRFIQEAKAAAALHHPHIATIFEIDDDDDVTFIVMELIEGDKLGTLLDRGGLPLERALELSVEIARGLARAHGKGIVHRDLKPANVMVTDEGHAKIIDFGIAKLIEPQPGKESDAVTALRKYTTSGQIMGTVSYMSPEQARGRKVDHRSDIFSFGVVLHELVTGSNPFERESGADTLSAILNEEPPRLPSLGASSALQVIVDRCLAKRPEDRYQTTDSLLAKLEAMSRVPSAASSGPGSLWWKLGSVAAALALVAFAGYNFRNGKLDVAPPRLANAFQVTSAVGVEDYPTWSPDGRTLAYAATQTGDTYGGNWDIWVTQLGVGQPVNRTGDHDGADRFPAWSPDGTQIAFWSDRDGGGYFVMSALGGAPRKVTSGELLIQPSPPQWSSDGKELACIVKDADGVRADIVQLQTGDIRRMTLPGRKTERFDLSWSPDNRFFAYVDATDLNNDVTQLWVLRLEDGDGFPVTDGWSNDWSPSWSADSGALFFVSNRGGSMDLWQQVMGDDGAPVGEAAPLTTGIVIRHAAFSPDGKKLAYSRGRRVANIWRAQILTDRRIMWNDAQQVTFDQAYTEYSDVSADGERIVFSTDRGGNHDLWVVSSQGGDPVQLTTDPAPDWAPRWSPDARRIAFYSYRTGNRDIWVKPADGGPARQITDFEGTDVVPTWSPDGREIAFVSTRSGNNDIWIVSAEGGDARQLTDHPATDHYPHWSPDGSSIVFLSTRDGKSRLWQIPSDGGDAELLTEGSALYPRWSSDGRSVYFTGTGETLGNIWALSLDDRTVRPLTDLSGKEGSPGIYNLGTAGRNLFFAWEVNLGDLWVMDVSP